MPYKGKKIAAVVPAHNEERLIGRVISGMPAFVDRIIVADDGSTDGTARRVKELADRRVCLLQHPSRQGVGAAIRSGYRSALSRGADVIAVMAGDAQMHPNDLPALMDPLVDSRADYAKGNRLMRPELYRPMPGLRRFGNRLLSFMTRLAVGRREIQDSQCGYTAISAAALRDLLRLRFCNGYGYPNEILCSLAILDKKIVEVPVRAVYGEETSSAWIHSYAIKLLLILARCFLRRIICKLPAGTGRRD